MLLQRWRLRESRSIPFLGLTLGHPVSDLHKKWGWDREYQAAYDALRPEFELARSLIEACMGAGLTQAQLAERMETTHSVVARLESVVVQ